MIHKISYYFSIKLSSNTDEQEILQYGFECLINSIIPISFFCFSQYYKIYFWKR